MNIEEELELQKRKDDLSNTYDRFLCLLETQIDGKEIKYKQFVAYFDLYEKLKEDFRKPSNLIELAKLLLVAKIKDTNNIEYKKMCDVLNSDIIKKHV